ncbi:hypothetical protein [uncultured Ruegeria sp.]|uniref:hypothetical protein n=1 Tax=uncultured Ruegeria sp. TaxID=259304 RepID=UPI0026073777|nr:hypothetical protein [uncultured Ruegeria sp.]
MADGEIHAYAVPSTKESRVHFGDFMVDRRLSNERSIVANSLVENTLTNAIIELWTDGEPIGIAFTIQHLPRSKFVEVVYGFCGDEN